MNLQKAEQVHLIASRTCFVLLAATLIVAAMPRVGAQIPVVPKHGWWLAASALLIAGLGFGMSRRNRTCAVAAFIYCAADQAIWWTHFRTPRTDLFQAALMCVSLGVVFLLGIPATFALHRKAAGADDLRLAEN